MDLDTFMREGLQGSDSDDQTERPAVRGSSKKNLKRKKSQGEKQREKGKVKEAVVKTKKLKSKAKEEPKTTEKRESGRTTVSQHKAVLGSLAGNDPEFYKFLQEEDKNLLNFDESSDDEGDVHKLPGQLIEQKEKEERFRHNSDSDSDDDDEVSDDVSDDSDDDQTVTKKKKKSSVSSKVLDKGAQHVTESLIEKWCRRLETNPRLETIDSLVKALQGAVIEASGETQETQESFYKVEGQANFNAVVRACLRMLPTAFAKVLNYDPRKATTPPSKCKRWTEFKPVIRGYLSALLALLKNLAAPDVINAVLKHITQLTSYISSLPKHTRYYMKAMIHVWCTGEETSRVLSFLSIIRLVRLRQEDLLEKTLKAMYMAYVRNCKFTSPTLLPMISFMQHSLVEIFALDKLLGYQYTFVYIRQLAIHLRNAMASKKKESYQAVYNWQFIHSCGLFSRLVATLHTDDNITQLTFPLIQIILGTIRLIPTSRYYPLRFQCVRMLNLISLKTGTFIPVMSQVLEILEITDFQKKMSRVNTRPIDFSCILKLSKTQTQDRAFKDGVMDQIYELILDNLVCYSHTLNFPELLIPAIHQMKQFVKTCKIANFTKQFKQILAKIEETSRLIEQRRKSVSIDLTDKDSVRDFERRSRTEGTPITVYYKQYRLLRDREVQLEIAGKQQMEERDKTTIIPTGTRSASQSDRQEFSSLFDKQDNSGSDESSDDDDEERFKPKHERKKKTKKSKNDDDSDDDVSSLNSEEYAMLDKDYDSDDGDQSEGSDGDDVTGDEGDDSSDADIDNIEGEDVVEDLELSDLDD